MRVSVWQCDAGRDPPSGRLQALEAAAAECAGHSDVLVCPELYACGYHIGAEEVHRRAESVDGAFSAGAREIARRHRVALVYGYAERVGDTVFNSACCVDADGRLLANHRKLYLSGPYEERAFTTGCAHTVFELLGVRTGLLICFDVEFPESVRALRRAGCDLVLVPTALVERWVHLTRTLVPTRAVENGLFVVYANYAGEENGARYCGNSLVAGPDGFERARAGERESLLASVIDIDDNRAARAALPYLEKLGESPANVHAGRRP